MYIVLETKEVVSQGELRRRNPNTSFPAVWDQSTLDLLGVAPIFPSPRPEYNHVTQTVREIAPSLTDKGHWEQQWEVVSAFTEYIDDQGVVHTVADQEAAAIARELNGARVNATNAIKTERDRRTQTSGYKVTVEGVDKWFHSDVFSRNQQLGLVLLGANIPENLQWKTMDGSFVTMTPALSHQLFASAAASDAVIFSYAEALIRQVNESATPAAVDINTGWPIAYFDLTA